MVTDGFHVDRLVFDRGLAVGRAYLDTDAATGAVIGRDLDDHSFTLGPLPWFGFDGAGEVSLGRDLHTDGGMRTHKGTPAAVDTDVRIPDRDLGGDGAFLPLGRSCREGAIDG